VKKPGRIVLSLGPTLQKLDHLAKEEDRSRSSVVRRLVVEAYLKSTGEKIEESFLAHHKFDDKTP
jgi:hypothetical protein